MLLHYLRTLGICVPASLQIICPPSTHPSSFSPPRPYPRTGQLLKNQLAFLPFPYLPHGGKDTPLQPFQGNAANRHVAACWTRKVCVLVESQEASPSSHNRPGSVALRIFCSHRQLFNSILLFFLLLHPRLFWTFSPGPCSLSGATDSTVVQVCI